jgi:hypothetical protein
MGLDALGSSSREARRMSLFSTVAGGGLLGFGPRRFAFAVGDGGAEGGTDALAREGEVSLRSGTGLAPSDRAAGAGISGALGTGRFVPGGGAGAFAGMI